MVALITLWPSPVDEAGRSTLLLTLERLHARGWPRWVGYAFVERAANVLMFVPFGALLGFLLPPRRRWLAVVLPATASVLVEVVQHLALPLRLASGWDVVANATGAALGVLLVVGIMALPKRRTAPAPDVDLVVRRPS